MITIELINDQSPVNWTIVSLVISFFYALFLLHPRAEDYSIVDPYDQSMIGEEKN